MENAYIQINITWDGVGTLYAGTPLDANGKIANNETAVGILAEDLNTPDRVAKVMIAGEWDEDVNRSRIVIRNCVKKKLSNIKFKRGPFSIVAGGRVASLDDSLLAGEIIIDIVGIPTYVSDVSEYSAYGITETGWYAFTRIEARNGGKVTAQTAVTGAAGSILTLGAEYIDIAVKFEVAAQAKTVVIDWGNSRDTFVFRATDLAVRNLDYRSTFYVYDIAPFTEWSWALTTDETFAEGKTYYTRDGDEYTAAEVTVGDTVPADTYYTHSKVTFSGMVRNVTYRLNEMIDCPIEIVLPEVPDDGYGAWFEIQMQYSGSFSTTLLPTDEDVVIGTASTQSQTAGINVIDLQYSDVNGVKMWTLLNTHSNLPTPAAE